MMTKKGSTKIVNFMTPRAGVLMLGCGHISLYIEYTHVLYSTLSIYSTFIAIALRDYDDAFLYHRLFSFILWWGCWYTWQDVLVKSLLRMWPLRPVGLLFLLGGGDVDFFCLNQRVLLLLQNVSMRCHRIILFVMIL